MTRLWCSGIDMKSSYHVMFCVYFVCVCVCSVWKFTTTKNIWGQFYFRSRTFDLHFDYDFCAPCGFVVLEWGVWQIVGIILTFVFITWSFKVYYPRYYHRRYRLSARIHAPASFYNRCVECWNEFWNTKMKQLY